jgi:CRISPR system Cascade subunit CasB
MLAHLRAARGASPGAVPSIWAVTMDGAPGTPRDDAPTHEEIAIHEAMTTYAAHQQSRAEPMHVAAGPSLGHAVRRLEATRPHLDGGLSPVRRRFNAVLTASSFEEVTHHLRGLVDLLRTERIPLDYGRLADDLYWLQDAKTSDSVLRQWGRDLYKLDDAKSEIDPDNTQEEQ